MARVPGERNLRASEANETFTSLALQTLGSRVPQRCLEPVVLMAVCGLGLGARCPTARLDQAASMSSDEARAVASCCSASSISGLS